MKYFKDENNSIFAYNDNVKEEVIKSNLTEITTEEYKSFKVFGVFDKTPDEVQEKLDKREEAKQLNKIVLALQSLCDSKSQDAENYIAGKKVTDKQLSRYKEKFKMATDYKLDGSYEETLSLEAEFQGVSVEDLADLIVSKGTEYEQDLLKFNAKIEAFRIKLSKLITDGEIDRANEILVKAELLGADTTDDDIKELFE